MSFCQIEQVFSLYYFRYFFSPLSFWSFPTLPFQSLAQKAGARQGLCLPPGPKGGKWVEVKGVSPPLKQQQLPGCGVSVPAGSHGRCCSSQLPGFEEGVRGRKKIGNVSYPLTICCYLLHFLTTGLLELPLSSLGAHSWVLDFDEFRPAKAHSRERNDKVRPFESWSSFSKLLLDSSLFRACK